MPDDDTIDNSAPSGRSTMMASLPGQAAPTADPGGDDGPGGAALAGRAGDGGSVEVPGTEAAASEAVGPRPDGTLAVVLPGGRSEGAVAVHEETARTRPKTRGGTR